MAESKISSQHQLSVGTFLAVQWLRLHASDVGSEISTHGWGTRVTHAKRHGHISKLQALCVCVCFLLKNGLFVKQSCPQRQQEHPITEMFKHKLDNHVFRTVARTWAG